MSKRKRFVPHVECKHSLIRVQDEISYVLLNNGISGGLTNRNLLDDLTDMVARMMLDHADEIFQTCIKTVENE